MNVTGSVLVHLWLDHRITDAYAAKNAVSQRQIAWPSSNLVKIIPDPCTTCNTS